ncbi:type II secretion system protein [Massilia putida]|uniref:type II secretion system protein n=1 Tax=Massilia putida TaxID=1141883 RepID=UPI000A845256|nr:type II secretion system protein [Massilia putida]
MARKEDRPGRGFTLLEFAIVVAVTAALCTVLLHRLDGCRRAAEEAATRQTVAALRTALQVEVTRALAQGRTETLAELAGQNPIRLLARPPANYLGEFALAEQGRVARNGWVFDPRDKILVYLTSERERFASGKSKLPMFKVELTRNPAISLALNEVGEQGVR